MGRVITSFLRDTFIVSTILCWTLGNALLLAPQIVWGGTPVDPIFRVVGAALLGFAFGSLQALQVKEWEKVEIIVVFNIAFLFLTGSAMTWVMLFGQYPPQGWLLVILPFGLLVLFLRGYYKEVTLNKLLKETDSD